MRKSRTRRRWAQNKPVLATVAHFRDPQSAELIGLMGFDCLWIDLEHQPIGTDSMENMIRAARTHDMDVMARAAKGEFMRAVRLLEAGAMLLMYPRCDDAQEARELVRWSKFPPLGERGYFSASPDNPYCLTPMREYLRDSNQETVIVAQIESPAAVRKSREIAEVPGVDMLFFGPGDFAVIAGVPGEMNSKIVKEAEAEVCRQALAAGKRFGTLVFSVAHGKQVLDMGASLVCYGGDLHFVREALTQVKKEFGALGIDFDDKVTTQVQRETAV